MPLSRRTFLTTSSAVLAAPASLRADDALSAIRSRAGGFDQMHALIVMQRGDILIEDRFNGPALDRPANIKSVSKTIVATILGIAIDKGVVPSVSATIGDIAPRLIPAGADPRVREITLEDLVTLRAGLERTSGPNYGEWVSSRNWVADALSRPFLGEPGGRMLYSTGSTHILGAVLAEASGHSLLRLARDWIGQPLDIDIPPWTRDPQGYFMGGNEMALSPLAMARFGEMIRMGGTWNGTQVVSSDWIDRSFAPVTRSPWSGLGYGLPLGQNTSGVNARITRAEGAAPPSLRLHRPPQFLGFDRVDECRNSLDLIQCNLDWRDVDLTVRVERLGHTVDLGEGRMRVLDIKGAEQIRPVCPAPECGERRGRADAPHSVSLVDHVATPAMHQRQPRPLGLVAVECLLLHDHDYLDLGRIELRAFRRETLNGGLPGRGLKPFQERCGLVFGLRVFGQDGQEPDRVFRIHHDPVTARLVRHRHMRLPVRNRRDADAMLEAEARQDLLVEPAVQHCLRHPDCQVLRRGGCSTDRGGQRPCYRSRESDLEPPS